jgi:hypothetical protein
MIYLLINYYIIRGRICKDPAVKISGWPNVWHIFLLYQYISIRIGPAASETQQNYLSQRWMLDERNLEYHLNQLEVWNGVNKSLNDWLDWWRE